MGTLLLVYKDYDNIFHQTGSFVAAFEYVQQVKGADFGKSMEVVFLDPWPATTTSQLWSPVLALQSPTSALYMAKHPSSGTVVGRREFDEVLMPMASRAHWWWNVWKDDFTERRPFFRSYQQRVLEGLGIVEGVPLPTVVTLLVRTRKTRRLLNPGEVHRELQARLPSLTVESVDFGDGSSWLKQLAQVRRTKLLVSTHGAGLVWNLLLPQGAAVLELLGRSQGNAYFKNECRWTGRPYGVWKTSDPKRESSERGTTPFQNSLVADPVDVARVAVSLLQGAASGAADAGR